MFAAREAGVKLGFFTGNASTGTIRFETSSSGVPNRVVVCYKDELIDPVSDPSLMTTKFRDPPLNRPEQTLMGVQYTPSSPPQDTNGFWPSYVVSNSSHWVYAGTGFSDGATVRGLVGPETDRFYSGGPAPNSIPGTYTLLSNSRWGPGPNDVSNASIYQAPSGAWYSQPGRWTGKLGLDTRYAENDRRCAHPADSRERATIDLPLRGPATVISVTPTGGTAAGGTAHIQGTNFVSGATVASAHGRRRRTFVNSTTITATTSAHPTEWSAWRDQS